MTDCQHTCITIEWYERTTEEYTFVSGRLVTHDDHFEPDFHSFHVTCQDCEWESQYSIDGWREHSPPWLVPLIEHIIYLDTYEEEGGDHS